MNYKRTWNKKFGKSEIYTKENAACRMVEIDMVRLRDGERKSYDIPDHEFALVILGGKCDVRGDGFAFDGIGERADVFGGPATCLYIPRNRAFTITGAGEVSLCVCRAPAVRDHEVKLIRPQDAVIKNMGKPGWQRQASFLLDERTDADILYIGECYVAGGQWASYPPHKHDDDNMPVEAATEEIYYYEFKEPSGFGIQRVYTKEGDVDEVYVVHSGDFVEIPRGYHPFHTAPGYDNYYLWIMAGPHRGFYMTTDEDHIALTK